MSEAPQIDAFPRRDGQLHVEDVPVESIANEVGTPTYVMRSRELRKYLEEFG